MIVEVIVWCMFMMIYAKSLLYLFGSPGLGSLSPFSRFQLLTASVKKSDGKEGVNWKGGKPLASWPSLTGGGFFGHWHPELWKILAIFWIFHDLICVFVVFQKVHCLVNWTFGNLCLTFLRFFLFGKEHFCVGRFQPRWLCR